MLFRSPRARLAVEVDGSHHFSGSMHGVPAAQQYDYDRQVDAACVEQGQRLVRLHYLDEGQWVEAVLAARNSKETVTYTNSYGL